MSKEGKRYSAEECTRRIGLFVPASDYDALRAERDRLRESLANARKEAVYGLKHARSFLQASAALGRISAATDAALQGEQP